MRNFIGSWTVAIVATALVGGCASQRSLLSKADPPKNGPKPEERVRYGFPWSKPKDQTAPPTGEMPADLKEQLARSKVAPPKSTAASKETLVRAAEAETRGDLDSARAAYLQVVETDPKNAEAHHRLGVIADMRQDPQSADQHYMQAYSINRRDADLLCDMGYSLYLRGRMEESERRLKEALEVNAYHRAALSNLGLVYGKQGRYDEALALFRKAGTESEAQRNIAQLFPNGRPDGDKPEAAVAETKSTPFPPTKTASAGAPPMPSDIDRRLTALATDPIQPGSPPPAMNPATPRTAKLAEVGNLQPSLPGPPGSPFGAAASPTAQPAVAAKPQGTGQPWTGSLEQPLSPADLAAMAAPPPSSNPAASMMSPGLNPFPMTAAQPSTTPTSNGIAAAGWPDASFPAGFNPDPASLGVVHAGGPMNPADASRLAAQLAMGAGPGSLIPLANHVSQPAPPAIGQPSFGQPAYGQPAFGQPAPMPTTGQPAAQPPASGATNTFSIPATWANDRSFATPVEAIPHNPQPPSSPPAHWGQPESIAPASPWAGSTSPANASTNWQMPPDNTPNMAPQPPAYGFGSAPAVPPTNPNTVQPPQWPGAASNAPWPPANAPTTQNTSATQPNQYNGSSNWPVIQPAGASTAASPSMPPAGGTTTVQDWPYAPSRP